MEHTKNKYKKKISDMSFDQLIKERGNLQRELMKGRMNMSMKQSPYGFKDSKENRYDMRMLKWRHAQVCNKLHNMAR